MQEELKNGKIAHAISALLFISISLSISSKAFSSTLQFSWETPPTGHQASINITIAHNDALSTSTEFTVANSFFVNATSVVGPSTGGVPAVVDATINSFDYHLDAINSASFASIGLSQFEFSDGSANDAIFNFDGDSWFVGKSEIYQTKFGILTGTITAVDFQQPSAVPLPASAWLMGSALLGLLGFSRKKKL